MSWIISLIWICGFYVRTGGCCNFPSFLSGEWISSDKGVLIFNSTHLSHYRIQGSGFLTFICESNTEWDYILKSTDVIDPIGSSTLFLDVYICLKLEKLSTTKLLYYLGSDKVSQLGNERLAVYGAGRKATYDGVCHRSNYASNTHHILIKKDVPPSSAIECPPIISGNFSYGGNDCVGESNLDVCTEKSMLTFDHKCSSIQGYSSTGKLMCLYSTIQNGLTYLSVYNTDTTVDGSSTYRFTCFVLAASDDLITATQYPQRCFDNQTDVYVPPPGITTRFKKLSDCGSSFQTGNNNTVAIICVCMALLITIVVVAGIIILKKGPIRKRCRRNKLVPTEVTTTKVENYITKSDQEDIAKENIEIIERFQEASVFCNDSSSSDEDENQIARTRKPKTAFEAFGVNKSNYIEEHRDKMNELSLGHGKGESFKMCNGVILGRNIETPPPPIDSLHPERLNYNSNAQKTVTLPPSIIVHSQACVNNDIDSRPNSRVRTAKSVRFDETPQIYSIEANINDSLLTLFEKTFEEPEVVDGQKNGAKTLTLVEPISIRAHTPIINRTTSPPTCREATTMTELGWSTSDDSPDSDSYDDDFESSNSSSYSSSNSSISSSSSFSSLYSTLTDEYEITSSDNKDSEPAIPSSPDKKITPAKDILARNKRETKYTTLQKKETATRTNFIQKRLSQIEGTKMSPNGLKSKMSENGDLVCTY